MSYYSTQGIGPMMISLNMSQVHRPRPCVTYPTPTRAVLADGSRAMSTPRDYLVGQRRCPPRRYSHAHVETPATNETIGMVFC